MTHGPATETGSAGSRGHGGLPSGLGRCFRPGVSPAGRRAGRAVRSSKNCSRDCKSWMRPLAGAIQDVPLPDGLAARFAAAPRGRVKRPLPGVQRSAAVAPRKVGRPLLSLGRGRFGVGRGGHSRAGRGSAMACAHISSRPQTALSEGLDFYVSEARGPGQSVDDVAPPSAWPLSRAVLPLRGVRWRSIQGFLDCRGLAYDLPGPGGAQATLYVVRRIGSRRRPHRRPVPPWLRAIVPRRPGRKAGLLYVLVVRGDASAYAAFLDLPRGPLT